MGIGRLMKARRSADIRRNRESPPAPIFIAYRETTALH